MRECISIPIGQAGLQIFDKCLEIYSLEHAIQFDGTVSMNQNRNQLLDTLFYECRSDNAASPRYASRSILIDHEPSVIQSMLSGPKSQLYSSRLSCHGKEDAANNFARGHFTLARDFLPKTMDVVRKCLEPCDSFQGFLFFNSFGGGTGSGFTATFIDSLKEYCHQSIMELNVFPSSHYSTATVEPYNAILRASTSLDYSDCMILFENEACFDICKKHLDIECAHYSHINQLIAQVASSITASTRFGGSLNVDLAEYQTNLVPFPKIHFLSAAYAPIVNHSKSLYQTLSANDITQFCIDPRNHMIQYEPNLGQYFSCCFLYRGDVTPQQVTNATIMVKNNRLMPFSEFSPTGFKIGLANEPPSMVDEMTNDQHRAVCLLANNSSMKQCWKRLIKKFDLMFRKRAFVHWFVGEGMEEMEFCEARENIQDLIDCYEYLEQPLQQSSPLSSTTPFIKMKQNNKFTTIITNNNDNYDICGDD